MGPIASHSAWIEGPPFTRIAPATPDPSFSSELAAFTMASTFASVMSLTSSRIRSITLLTDMVATGSPGGNRAASVGPPPRRRRRPVPRPVRLDAL
jgi:hypothetical protein